MNFYTFFPHLLSDLVKFCVREQHVVFLNLLHSGEAKMVLYTPQ